MSNNCEKYSIEGLINNTGFIQWAKYPTDVSDFFGKILPKKILNNQI